MSAERPRAPRFVTLPAGSYRVGNAEGRHGEAPERVVTLQAFRLAVAPVTNAEFGLFQRGVGHEGLPFGSDENLAAAAQPVVGANWFDAVAYLDWLSRELGDRFRLPTEDEREVAARGGLLGEDWPWGSAEPEALPALAEIAALARPHAPGPACANALGLSCMADNVHEWCADWAAGTGDTTTANTRRASRGGSWRHHRKFTRVWARSSLPPDRRYADYGFRVCADG